MQIQPIQPTNSINFINSFNAKNAFSAKNYNEEVHSSEKENFELNHVSNAILNKIDVNEVQKYAANLGENQLSEEELKYGLVFGRSVLVNVKA